jgi:NAD(P)-dependent dehydrogenase (short-subunit alcohol dehydrogenase family)
LCSLVRERLPGPWELPRASLNSRSFELDALRACGESRRVEGRVTVVTGAGRGIGRATAIMLAGRGARVLGVSRTASELESLAREAAVETLVESVADEEACHRIAAEAHRRLGAIEILVNNAGIGSAHERPIWQQPTETWRETMATNLDGPFFLTRLAARDMRDAGYGRIVMVSSTAGEKGGPAESAYDASKHGLLGLMRSVSQDLGAFGATCNAVLPGWVRTEMAERSARAEAERRAVSVDEIWAERGRQYPRGTVIDPEEVAAVITFLASSEASGVNGEAITVAAGGFW